jgi:hypothetical protein
LLRRRSFIQERSASWHRHRYSRIRTFVASFASSIRRVTRSAIASRSSCLCTPLTLRMRMAPPVLCCSLVMPSRAEWQNKGSLYSMRRAMRTQHLAPSAALRPFGAVGGFFASASRRRLMRDLESCELSCISINTAAFLGLSTSPWRDGRRRTSIPTSHTFQPGPLKRWTSPNMKTTTYRSFEYWLASHRTGSEAADDQGARFKQNCADRRLS